MTRSADSPFIATDLVEASLLLETSKAAAIGAVGGAFTSASFAWWMRGLSRDMFVHVATETPRFGDLF